MNKGSLALIAGAIFVSSVALYFSVNAGSTSSKAGSQLESSENLDVAFFARCGSHYENLVKAETGKNEVSDSDASLIRERCGCMKKGFTSALSDSKEIPQTVRTALGKLFTAQVYRIDDYNRPIFRLIRTLRSEFTPSEDKIYLSSVDAFANDATIRFKQCMYKLESYQKLISNQKPTD